MTMVPHFAFPFSVNGSSFTVREQDTIGEIQDCVTVLALTPIGTRTVLPGYGVPELLYSQAPASTAAILSACNRWEPRASLDIVTSIDAFDEKMLHVAMNIAGGLQ